MEKLFQNIKYFVLSALLLIFPLFFLNLTQEFFVTNKLYLLSFIALLLLFISAVEILVTKKLKWEKKPFDLPIGLLIVSLSLSVIFSSPNKIQALLNPSFGLIIFVSLGIIYFYFSRNNIVVKQFSNLTSVLTIILSLITVTFFFQPFENSALSSQWQFLKNPNFTPLGGHLDLAIFLGFFLVYNILFFKKRSLILNLSLLIFNVFAFSLTIYKLFFASPDQIQLILPPLSTSWYAVLEVMKNVKTAFLGVGPDNFSTVFTRVKDFSYNQSAIWQIASFNIAGNLPFQLLVETGVLGFFAFVFIAIAAFKSIKPFVFLFAYLFLLSLVLPPSLSMLFLFFIVLSIIAGETKSQEKETSLDEFPVLYLSMALTIFALIGASSYLFARSYKAEYYFKKAINNVALNNAKEVYENMKRARLLNSYEERYIVNFSQTNLLIANNLIQKNKDKISEQDRLTVTQAVQAAISEAKLLVARNPNNSTYYENLANVYRNIIPLASGADAWTVSAYQRAIILDPANPSYRLSLGGVYYLLGQYNDAIKLFEQAVSLKPNWSNASYNLAWAYFQNKEYDKATNAMQNVVNLVDKKSSPKDWEKANKELEDFKNKLAEVEKNDSSDTSLNLPKESENKLDPKLNLPPEASPEAK